MEDVSGNFWEYTIFEDLVVNGFVEKLAASTCQFIHIGRLGCCRN